MKTIKTLLCIIILVGPITAASNNNAWYKSASRTYTKSAETHFGDKILIPDSEAHWTIKTHNKETLEIEALVEIESEDSEFREEYLNDVSIILDKKDYGYSFQMELPDKKGSESRKKGFFTIKLCGVPSPQPRGI